MKDSEELHQKIELLEQKQAALLKELALLKKEVYQNTTPDIETEIVPKKVVTSSKTAPIIPTKKTKPSFSLEALIGENIINKIGIIITILGVSIGAKYSIEHDLISPSTRIILGYIVGFILLALGFKLQKKYTNYAPVLTSGAFTILYFITYIAYSLYTLLPQWIAFSMMCLLTVATVLTALKLNKQVIAHIGLVGAYAVPFLLSNNNGAIATLFIYIGIINLGILFIAVHKYWKALFYNAFMVTWLFFISWFVVAFEYASNFRIAFVFLNVIYITFYGVSLAYKLIKKENYSANDLPLILGNSFLFFSVGYVLLEKGSTTENYTGLFALYNAILHGLIALLIYKQPVKDTRLQQLITGLSLLCITLAILIECKGSWLPIFWSGEAAILFYIGRSKKMEFYEKFSLPLLVLSFYSLGIFWFTNYGNYSVILPETKQTLFMNSAFLTSMVFVSIIGFMNFINLKSKKEITSDFFKMFSYLLPFVFIAGIYFTFYQEISEYWSQLYKDSFKENHIRNKAFIKFKIVWLLNYSFLFVSVLIFINYKKVKNNSLSIVTNGLSIFFTLIYLIVGLLSLSLLRDLYLKPNDLYIVNSYYLWIRYITYLCLGLLSYTVYKYNPKARTFHFFDLIVYTVLLWVLSSELIHLLEVFTAISSYKLALSIFWAIYSLFLISVGIWKQKQPLRIAAIVLFGVILAKLFLYDISHLETIAKTMVFISLGVILLIISFLYNKYKHLIDVEQKESSF